MLVKQKTKFGARFNNYKSKHRSYRKKNIKYHSNVYMNIMANTVIMGLMIGSSHQLNNVKHTNSLKREKHFGNTGLKRFTLIGWMKRNNIYIKSPFLTFPKLSTQFFNHFIFCSCFCFSFYFIFVIIITIFFATNCDIELPFDCFIFSFS